jgi:hypothetical protein
MLTFTGGQHEYRKQEADADFMEKKSLGKRPFRGLTWRREDIVKLISWGHYLGGGGCDTGRLLLSDDSAAT